MEDIKLKKLKEKWGSFKNNWDFKSAKNEYDSFIKKYPKNNLGLNFDNYTNIKENEETEYFTYFIERKTENCGKFRTSSSFAYGVYKVNIKNIDEKKYLKEHEYVRTENFKDGVYRSSEQKSKDVLKDKYITKENAEKYFKDKVLPKIEDLIEFKDIEDVKPLDINYARKVAYMYNPDKLIPIYKNDVIQAIAEFFGIEDITLNSYKATKIILDKFIKIFEIEESELSFETTQKIGSFLWKYFGKLVSFDSKNMILYGAPGTGKTYLTDSTIKNILKFSESDNKQYQLVQFHPSFGYEEFIDGIKPVKSNNETMNLELINGMFKKMCIDAFEELKRFYSLSKEDRKKHPLKDFYFVADEINRAELSRVFGELLLCLEEDKRLSIKQDGTKLKLNNKSVKIKTQNTMMWEKKHVVLFVDRNGDILDKDDKSSNDKENWYFGIPENLYFIGTMNDIDRSVDSFDMALRRRFVWKQYVYDKEVVEENYIEKCDTEDKLKKLEEYLLNCDNLNKFITSKNGLNLPEAYMLGQSYFMDLSSFSDNQLNKRWNEKILPLVTEYLRAEILDSKELKKKLNCMKKIFTKGEECK